MAHRPVVACCILCLAAAACDSGSSRREPVLASATLGPAGGELAIAGGALAGWRLEVPAGALAAPTELRVYAADLPLIVETGVVPTEAASSGFRIEPVGLELAVRATLRAPFLPASIAGTAPGNVRLREVRSGNVIDQVPAAVDIPNGHIDGLVRFLGSYQVVVGPRAASLTDYWQPLGAAVALAGGRTFTVEPPLAGTPLAASSDRRWRYEGSHGVDLLYFLGSSMTGREATDENWREVWDQSFPAWQFLGATPGPQAATIGMQVEWPLGGPSIGGQMTVQAQWNWDAPQPVGDTLATDVVRLWITLTWNRADLGVGTRDYRFWFAPELGLVALAEDGVVHRRTTP